MIAYVLKGSGITKRKRKIETNNINLKIKTKYFVCTKVASAVFFN